MSIYDCIIIGGGASGMMTAVFAGRRGLKTLILEQNEKLGKKLYITGKGRCNITNNSSVSNHLANIVTNSRFMHSSLNSFTPQDVIEFFETNGLKLKTERGNRVFPASDKSSDVIKTLENAIKQYGVEVKLNSKVAKVNKANHNFNILCSNGDNYTSRSLVIATGGLSYSATGSTGVGLNFAKDFGHNIIEMKSALCPIVVGDDISTLNGLSLKNVELTVKIGKKEFKEMGEMMVTYNSLTGPIALTLSSKINKFDLRNCKLYLDFKPALSREQLESKFKREFIEFAKRDVKNYLYTLLPTSIVEYFMNKVGLVNKKVADFSRLDREKLIEGLKRFDFSNISLDNINTSIVTSGGIDTKELNSKTCESKLVNNLYFTGEIIDVDALTCGYNLQIAWSTAFAVANALKG